MLSNVRIVLVNTTHPGNIGAAARAMKNMGQERLYLVGPSHYPSAEATARAAGADDVLARAYVCADLDAALSGCHLVLGASARLRSVSWPQIDPRECARQVLTESLHGDVALVFGREKSGLSNSELDRCHYLVHIPAHPEFQSLNLAAAVQILCYEIRQAFLHASADGEIVDGEVPVFATAEEMEGFYGHLEQTLADLGFLNPDHPRKLMRQLRRIFNRARPDRPELNILRGILSAAQARKSMRRVSER